MCQFFNRRGAMFGLDARISLSVFAVLGVIAGVITYSTVTEARATSQMQTVKAVTQAIENYTKDTKVAPTSFDDFFKSAAVAGWSGPYLTGNFEQLGKDIWQASGLTFSLTSGAGDEGVIEPSPCSSADNCYAVLNITSGNGNALLKMDTVYDGAEDATAGAVRTLDNGDGTWQGYIIIKSAKAAFEGGGGVIVIEL